MILNLLRDFDKAIENGEVSDGEIKNFYLNNAYKYYQLNGKSIILPEVYFNLKR